MPPAKFTKPQAKSAKAEPSPWDWATKTEIKDIGLNELQQAYRITGFSVCKTQCRRNCKKNPKCLWGLGERKWLQVGEDPANGTDDTSDVVRNEGQIVGIQNLGATCYVNSLLQLWFHNPILRRAILEWKPPSNAINDPENYVPNCPIGHLQAMFARLKLSKQSSIDPSPFVVALELNAGEQQDAQEFAKLLLTLIDELLAKYQHQSVRTVIKDSFTGDCQYETECSVCKTKTIQQSVFNELELTVNKHLRESIVQYLKEEILDGSNKYRCGTCTVDQVAQRSIKLKKLPPVLNLQLMRFVYDIETHRKKKVTTTIRFPEDLDMTEYILPEFRNDQKFVYTLTAVLVHDGKSASSGHYVAHIKDISSGSWYTCNDENVEKKPQSLKKSTALVLNETDSNSETTNGANGASKEPLKAKSYTSPGAYMLVYTRRDLHDNPPPDPDVHDYLMHLVRREDAVFEADLAKTKAEKELEEKKREEKQKEIDKLYEWYKVQATLGWKRSSKQNLNREDSQGQLNVSPKIGNEKDDLEFFPATWLANWVGEKQPAETVDDEIQTASLLCKHGKLSPPLPTDTVVPYRLVPVWFADSVYAKYGGRGRLQGEQVFCLLCVQQQCALMKKLSCLEEHSKRCVELVRQIDKEVANSSDTEEFMSDTFWASKDSLRYWKRYSKEEIHMSNVERFGMSSEEDSFIFNDDITCIHGNLEPNENLRKLVNRNVRSIILGYYPQTKWFRGSEPPCSECNDIKTSTSVVATENKAIAHKQKTALSDLFHNKNRPNSDDDIGQFYLVPTAFINQWRKFIKNPAGTTVSEIKVAAHDLLCDAHRKLKYPLDLIKEVQIAQGTKESIVTLLKSEEWEVIQEQFHFDTEISMIRGNDELLYYPDLCSDCSAKWFGEAVQKSLNYTTADIYVEKLDLGEKDPGSPGPSDTSSDQSNYSVPLKKERREQLPISNGMRRSTRTRHTTNQKRYQVSSNVTLKEFQLKLMNDYKAMLSDQHLMYEGRELFPAERELTFGQLRIKPGSVLHLKVDETKTDDSIEESPVQERGFSGTILQGHSRQIAMEH